MTFLFLVSVNQLKVKFSCYKFYKVIVYYTLCILFQEFCSPKLEVCVIYK